MNHTPICTLPFDTKILKTQKVLISSNRTVHITEQHKPTRVFSLSAPTEEAENQLIYKNTPILNTHTAFSRQVCKWVKNYYLKAVPETLYTECL